MNANRRAVLNGAAALLLMPRAWGAVDAAGTPTASALDLSDAINQAGRQRMLTQRAAKAWLTLAIIPDHAGARKVLSHSVALFETQLGTLESTAPNEQIRQTYGDMKLRWSDYKAVLTATGKDASTRANELLRLDAQVLRLAQKGTEEYEAVTGTRSAMLVNLSGRQRMLSQRMAKFYLAAALGIQTDDSTNAIQLARSEFLQAMKTLKAAPEATSAIQSELTLAEGQWFFFDAALQRLQSGVTSKTHISDVFVTSENLLTVMDKVTGMYASLQS